MTKTTTEYLDKLLLDKLLFVAKNFIADGGETFDKLKNGSLDDVSLLKLMDTATLDVLTDSCQRGFFDFKGKKKDRLLFICLYWEKIQTVDNINKAKKL